MISRKQAKTLSENTLSGRGKIKANWKAFRKMVKVTCEALRNEVWDALRNEKISYLPRKDGKTLKPEEYINTLNEELRPLDNLDSIDSKYLDLARESLTEVKNLTEYQDQKSGRLLTIVAFLTAAASALFVKLVDLYPIHAVLVDSPIRGILLGGVYLLFWAFIVLATCGALVTFHATQTRFLWQNEKSDDVQYDKARSYLFFQHIYRTTPDGWARSFVNHTGGENGPDRLSVKYYKNYIVESYLVAAKLGDKLRYLEPAQHLLETALRLLLIWFCCLPLVVICIPKLADSRVIVQLLPPSVAPSSIASNNAAPSAPAKAANKPPVETHPAATKSASTTAAPAAGSAPAGGTVKPTTPKQGTQP